MTRIAAMLLGLLLLGAPTAGAHGLDAGRLVLEVEDASVRVTGTPRVDAFPGRDLDHDGRLSHAEVAAARSELRAAWEAALRLDDGRGVPPTCEPTSVSTAGLLGPDGEGGGDHVRMSTICRFAARPDGLVVASTLPSPLAVQAVRLLRLDPTTAAPESDVETAVVAADRPEARLLGAPPPPSPAGSTGPLVALVAFALVAFRGLSLAS